jgi:hypothetical protein
VYCDLLELFAGVSDGRVGQGRDHPVAAVLALAAAAVVAGMKGYTAITGWVADVPPAILADLYLRSGAAPAPPPSKTTIWRVLTDAGTEAFDAAVGTWLMDLAGFTTPATAGAADCSRALLQVRLDGKAIRGARDADGNQVRLLAALAGPHAASVVAAQTEVGVNSTVVMHRTARASHTTGILGLARVPLYSSVTTTPSRATTSAMTKGQHRCDLAHSELAAGLDMTPQRLIKVQKYAREPISLHTPLARTATAGSAT